MKFEGEKLSLEYEQTPKGITIVAGHGTGALVALPDAIHGRPVTEIAKEAFAPPEPQTEEGFSEMLLPNTIEVLGKGAFSRSQSLKQIQLPQAVRQIPPFLFEDCVNLSTVTLGSQVSCIGAYSFHNCHGFKELYLPDSVTSIEPYAFYNCFGLKKVRIPAGLQDLGMGAFKNCDTLETIVLGGHTFLQSIVADFSQAFTFVIEYSETDQAVLLFPDFVYEYVEDYPARQFHQVNYGSGHFYRQCISNSEIDYRRYDELFRIALREETFEITVQIALNRLLYPHRLATEKRKKYLAFIQEHLVETARYVMKQGNAKGLEQLGSWELFTRETIEEVLEIAEKLRNAEYLSFLLDYKQRHFGTTEKVFDL